MHTLTGRFPPLLVALAIPLVTAAEPARAADGVLPPGLVLATPSGDTAAVESLRGAGGTVFVFLSSECPISRAFLPALSHIHAAAGATGIGVVGIESNADHDATTVAAHVAEFAISFPVVLDPRQELALALGATTCPTAVLVDAEGRVRYRGRVDDRFIRRGGAALEPTRRDLADAVEALRAGTAGELVETEVLGCPIHAAATEHARPATDGAASAAAVLAILERRCAECHRAGGIGPMDLTDPATVRHWADDIAAFTADGSMPPWKPVDGWGHFRDARRMPEDEIALVGEWVRRGGPAALDGVAPTGPRDTADGGPAPRWRMGEPDVILAPDAEYMLGADGADEYRCYVLHTDFAEDRFVSAFEILPGNTRVVHHVIAFVDSRGAARKLDAADPSPGYTTQGGWPGFLPSGGMGGWAPGNVPSALPEGTVRVLPAGADVVLQVHYHRSGRAEADRTRIGLHFSAVPPRRAVRMIPVTIPGGPLSGLVIKAGAERHVERGTLTVPDDMLAMAVTPHMHLLGREIALEARRPDGTREPLLRIDRWDFNWQETYRYEEPVPLPTGTRLHLETVWDNSAANPANPSKPPRDVRWGEQTTDEMGIVFLEVAPQREETDPAQVRAPTPDEQLRFFLATQSENRREGRVPWRFELLLKVLEARLAAADRGLAPLPDRLPMP